MNPLKIKILELLAKRKNKWLKTKTIAKELNLSTTEGINRVSNILYRLRHAPHIERKSNSHDYSYRYIVVAEKVHPTSLNACSQPTPDKKARGDSSSDMLKAFTFIEPLPEVREGYCGICEAYKKEVAFKAEKEGSIVLLCERHGKVVDKELGSYSGVFE